MSIDNFLIKIKKRNKMIGNIFQIFLFSFFLYGCDVLNGYSIYNDTNKDILIGIERRDINNQTDENFMLIQKKYFKEFKYLGHSFTIPVELLPQKLTIYNKDNMPCFIYDQNWFISKRDKNISGSKSYLYFILTENGMDAISYEEYAKLEKSKKPDSLKYDLNFQCQPLKN
ncbi:MAG: hypothetical protein LBU87_01240 [Lactobacillales bacterium]|jgi:hypothetical protein|nr:hypothetical protein [Lactobacillales bacterium]